MGGANKWFIALWQHLLSLRLVADGGAGQCCKGRGHRKMHQASADRLPTRR